jgi:polar amino acid transport system ATP-binding protein
MADAELMVRVDGVGKSFGTHKVLDGVSLEVPKGSVCIIIGPSGSGKSTLLRCINFLEPYQAGSIAIEDELVGYSQIDRKRKLRPRREITRMRGETGMVFQQFNLFAHMTALENVAIAPIKVKGVERKQARDDAERLLVKVGLAERMSAYPGFLSGGEQQRVAIARALAMAPKVLLLDEITSALDPERVGEVLEVIRTLADEGMTMLVVTHEMGFAHDIADQVVFMDEGQVIERGAVDILDDPKTSRLKGFLGKLEIDE